MVWKNGRDFFLLNIAKIFD